MATVSLPRDGAFAGLALQDELKKRDGEPWCGVCVVDLRTGDIVEWIRLDGAIKELFDVAVIPGVVCPMALGVQSPDIQSLISFDPEFGPLVAAPAHVQSSRACANQATRSWRPLGRKCARLRPTVGHTGSRSRAARSGLSTIAARPSTFSSGCSSDHCSSRSRENTVSAEASPWRRKSGSTAQR